MAQTTHLASFGPFLVVANFPVAYYNCKLLNIYKMTHRLAFVARVGRCGCGCVVMVVVVVAERVEM